MLLTRGVLRVLMTLAQFLTSPLPPQLLLLRLLLLLLLLLLSLKTQLLFHCLSRREELAAVVVGAELCQWRSSQVLALPKWAQLVEL